MEIDEIKRKYYLGNGVAGYLAEVLKENGNSWRDYERHKKFLVEMNLPCQEYKRAIKCLIDILEI